MKQVKLLVVFACVALLLLPAAAQVKDHSKIKYPKLPEFNVPKPEVFTMDNGMTVFLMQDTELPLINVSVRVRTGSNHEAAEKTGMGNIFGQVQREGGTTTMTGDEMDDFLESRAAFVETGMGGDVASASMNCLEDDFDEVFAVFVDVLQNPAFAEDKIELAKVQLNTSIARRNDNVGSIVGREFSRLIYGADSPLARMTEYATVAAVTRDDLVAWHKRYYHPNNMYLGVVGDFDPATMKQKLGEALGGWAKGPEADLASVAYQEKVEPGVYFIEKDDVTQANIRLGHLGIRRNNPDYFAVVVMNEVLGGGFSGRLMQNVRSKKGLAYSVFGGIGSSFMRQGIFQAGMSTKSETMAESVAALREEVEGIISNPPTAEEMKHARESILNSFVFNYTSKSQILGQQMTYAYYGMPADYLDTYRENIEKVTPQDVSRVAKKYIHPDETVLLVVGKSEDFDKPVDSFGQVTTIDISIPPPPDTRAAVDKSDANLEVGAATLEKMARSVLSGITAGVQAMTADYDLTIKMGGQSMSLGQTVSFMLPDKMRQIVRTPMGEQVVVLNGDRGFVSAAGQKQNLPRDRVMESLQSIGRDLVVLASNLQNPDLEAVAAGTEDVEGATCQMVSVAFLGSESRLCIDDEGRVLKQTYQGKHPLQGTPGMMEVVYSDFAEVAGYMVPRKHVLSFDGNELASITLGSMEVNPELDPAAFEVAD